MHRLIYVASTVLLILVLTGILPYAAVAGPEPASPVEQFFQKAKEDYLKKNMDSAARQIRKASSYMKDESAKASAAGKEALKASIMELDKLADDVKKGTVTSVKRMDKSFARAYASLASNAHVKSTEYWAKKEREKAGDALDSAANYLERSFAWADQKVETGTKDVIKKSKDLSLKLKKKGAVMTEEVGKVLKEAGNSIQEFAKRISAK
jgi:hypothetical protein